MTVNVEERAARARENFKNGYNCAQSVVMAYADLFNTPEETLAAISAPFGGGMGRLREVCGAVSGMFMVSGALIPETADTRDTEAKTACYQNVQSLAENFRNINGSIVCRELLGLGASHGVDVPTPSPRTSEYYKKRPCIEYVSDAAKIVGSHINNH